ncbi:MAG: tRNA pseudouridine(55) synthase TruB [Prevotella sp.]|jgi:tRNA pseudouridine55 synthase|nr:tRNA pseudouridine(55) synthase TruB [Prevotella sp.]MBO6234050.1 tRNA pseudouridine(55) synthase TruB [Prevotella sp.]
MNFVEGEILHINKPYGMSSFGALAFVRTRISKAVGVKRVKTGHAGTLDPLATGVLILCTGKCTKMIPTLQYHSKEYTATLQFGATTPSYDMEHPVNATFPTEHITEERIKAVLEQFKGDIMQVPPTYSAVKKNGDRAYELRRRGEDVKLDAKPVHIDDIELLWLDPEKMQAQIRVECGKGTYIRALARDIGRALDSGAYLTQLCRTRLGDVRIEDCIKLDDFQEWLDGVSTK